MTEKEEQIRVLLAGNPLEYACKKLDVEDMREHRYSEVFTVTRQEVQEYVREHGLPVDISFSSLASPQDGLFFYESGGEWLVYFGERGKRFDSRTFDSYNEALPCVVDWLLKLSGAGMF